MSLRNEVEVILHAWDKYEIERGFPPVIDYDCRALIPEVERASDRLTVYHVLSEAEKRAKQEGNEQLVTRIGAHLAYLEALMGRHESLDHYVQSTQGCSVVGWTSEYICERGELARQHLHALGIEWGPATRSNLNSLEEPLDLESAKEAIRRSALDLEPLVREATGSNAPYDLEIVTADVDAYWAYWLDGVGRKVRLRLNLKKTRFTKVQARQFALHEVLGHGLQGASYAARCEHEEVPWIRLLSVHAQQQVLLEGLAQALPLFISPEDSALVARVRLAHYIQLVLAELHLNLNVGNVSIPDCVQRAKLRVPFWSDEDIADAMSDRGASPLLRSYLWSYPAGIDWFVRLAETDKVTGRAVLQAAYRDPLTPDDLTNLWPTGPVIGGNAGTAW